MLHEKTPDQDGWYWVHQFDRHGSDLWFMAYLKVEGLDDGVRAYLKLIDVDDEGDYFGVENLRLDVAGQSDYGQIKHWIGPLSCPAGPFGGEIAEFTFERHQEAKAAGKALVMIHADVTDCDGVPGCRLTTTGLTSGQEAYDRTANFFKGDPICADCDNPAEAEKC